MAPDGLGRLQILAMFAQEAPRYSSIAVSCCLKQGTENGLITKVVRALYEPWLDRSARRFQELMSAPGVDSHKLITAVAAEREMCVLFADGLRFDKHQFFVAVLNGRFE